MSIILVVCFVLTLYMYYVGSSLALNIAFWIFAIAPLLYMGIRKPYSSYDSKEIA